MSIYDFRASVELMEKDPPFYALIMAAMLKGDTMNAAKLRHMFPETWSELDRRYNTRGGMLPEDGNPGETDVGKQWR